jgi:acyl carrier protein
MQISTQVGAFIRETLGGGRPDLTLEPGDPLVELGVLDSMGILELVTFLETRYGIRIDDHDMIPEHFGTLERIERFVLKKTGAATP